MIIFLLLLLIPATMAALFGRYLLTAKQAINEDEMVEMVLLEASEIVDDIIEEVRAECQAIAEEISSDEQVVSVLSSADDLQRLVADIMPPGSNLSVTIFDLSTELEEGTMVFSTATGTEHVPSSLITGLRQSRASGSYHEDKVIYGVSPMLADNSLLGAAVVHQSLSQELVAKYKNLQYLLKFYAIRPDLDIWQKRRSVIIVLVLVLAIAGVALGWIISRSVTKRILSLVAGTREISSGNLNHKVEVKGKDEIATLIESFNTMTSQLKASREREVRAERLAAWREVARRIAHEIKNPLTPIQLSMYRLRKNLGGEKYDEIFQQAYTSITNEVENLRNMVTEFSDFARMPKPRTKLSDPGEIVQNAMDLYAGLPDNIALHTELSDNLPQVMADDSQIRQVLHNLIGNAVEAMTDGGRLSVAMGLDNDDFVAIQISDTGCGMSEETRQRMFTPYFTTKETGTGLGMAITAQIIEEHSGEISVDSAEDVGTTVTVKLKAATGSEPVE
ncbi:ATP-binding protein [Candidatus Poribacteria bacterium]